MAKQLSRISVVGLGIGLGAMWCISVLFMGLMAWWFGWGTAMVEDLAIYYIGYGPSFSGIVLGIIWSFIDGFIGGVILAFFYNLALRLMHKS
ncbi:MAG: bacteriophage holin [Pseudomonadota bacterium]